MIKPHPKHKNYFVSDSGKVYRVTELKPFRYRGYARLSICNGVRKTIDVHTLVVETFQRELQKDEQINHKDKIRHHNWNDNLEICTCLENVFHRDNYEQPF